MTQTPTRWPAVPPPYSSYSSPLSPSVEVETPAANTTFQSNLEAMDPTGMLRALGEFLQTFTALPKEMDRAPHATPGGASRAPAT